MTTGNDSTERIYTNYKTLILGPLKPGFSVTLHLNRRVLQSIIRHG